MQKRTPGIATKNDSIFQVLVELWESGAVADELYVVSALRRRVVEN